MNGNLGVGDTDTADTFETDSPQYMILDMFLSPEAVTPDALTQAPADAATAASRAPAESRSLQALDFRSPSQAQVCIARSQEGRRLGLNSVDSWLTTTRHWRLTS